MGTAQRKEREKAKRRADIIDGAKKIFWQKGYNKTTMPEIADALELAPGTLYLYFPSKESLYIELLLEGYDLLTNRLREKIRPYAAPKEHISDLISVFFGFALDNPEYFDIIFFILQREFGSTRDSGLEKEQIKKLEEKEKTCKQLVFQILSFPNSKMSEKEIKLSVDAIWSMLAGVVFFWRKDSKENFESVSRQAGEIILKAIFLE